MAQPYRAGSSLSNLFSSKSIDVLNEHIGIKIINDHGYTARYQIRYELNTERAMSLPLLFIALGLYDNPVVKVNGETIKVSGLKNNTAEELKAYGFIKPSQSDSVNLDVYYEKDVSKPVRIENLVYFNGNLKKGYNVITVEYVGSLGNSRYGFISDFDLEYSLFPSKYWKSFGPIKIDLETLPDFTFKSASIGNPVLVKENSYSWTLNQLPAEDLKIILSPGISNVSKVLLFIEPFGLAIIAWVIFTYLHFVAIRKHRQTAASGYNWKLAIGTFLVPVLYYVVYFSSYPLIDWTIGSGRQSNHGYIFLVIFTLPIFWLFYGLVMWGADLYFKKKNR
ncbi:hypothetical protein [Pedobacter sp. NJ-S-72]